jgi:outer membrane protein TolC
LVLVAVHLTAFGGTALGQQPGAQQAGPLPSPSSADLLRIEGGGVTADQVGARAATTSFSAKAQQENLRGAAARVDQAWMAFLPRLSVLGRYTRLSDFTPPQLFPTPPGNSLYTFQPPTTDAAGNPAPGALNTGSPVFILPNQSIAIPLVLNNWLLQGTINVPISDYFLRINQNYTAAIAAHDAIRFDTIAARTKSAADGKVAYYTWLRMRGAHVVAIQALQDQQTHLTDAKNQFQVGNASRADVLRAETGVASAELTVERAKNASDLAEKQVRQAMHARDEERIVPGEGLDSPLAPVPGNLAGFTQEALSGRAEVKSIDANAAAARKQAEVARAGRYPVVSGFADAIYANPNPRKFPQTQDWFPTWDIGAQVTWSPNDAIVAGYAGTDAETRATSAEAQKGLVRDGIELEVMQAWQAIREADVALESTKRELASAQEAYRVARELFNNGRATSTTLTDAETDLTRARLDALNAVVDARIARVRLEHAVGRDSRLVQQGL